jgi:hypothetical protein
MTRTATWSRRARLRPALPLALAAALFAGYDPVLIDRISRSHDYRMGR